MTLKYFYEKPTRGHDLARNPGFDGLSINTLYTGLVHRHVPMWKLPLVLVVGLLFVAPIASAGDVSGELTSDAPIAISGAGTFLGPDLTVHHYAFRDGSLSGKVYSGYVVDKWTLHVPEDQPPACRDRFEGRAESESGPTADPNLIYTLIDFTVTSGSFARVAFPQNEVRVAIGAVGAPREDAAPSLDVGPNPYRYETQQPAASGAVPDRFAPVFPDGSFVGVPRSAFNAFGPLTVELLWGDLKTLQRERERVFHAGIIEDRRSFTEGPLATPVDCRVLETHIIEFQQQVTLISFDQEGADRVSAFWHGGTVGQAFSGGEVPPDGHWDVARGPDFAAALSELRLPATLIASPDLRVAVAGSARFERALGAVLLDGHTHETKDRGLTLTGNPLLQPVADDDGHRMTTRVSGPATVAIDGAKTPMPLRDQAPLIASATGGVAVLGFGAWMWPTLRFKATALLLTPLYARLKKEDLLENPLRDDILEVVDGQPGISASELGRRLECGWGTLVYHLTVLERMQLISSAREGRHKRFFVQGRINYSDKGAVGLLANPSAKLVLDAISATPGQIQRDLSRRLGLSPGTVAWHVERLAEAGLVLKEEEGRVVRYYPSAKLLELTRQLAA